MSAESTLHWVSRTLLSQSSSRILTYLVCQHGFDSTAANHYLSHPTTAQSRMVRATWIWLVFRHYPAPNHGYEAYVCIP